MDKIKNIIEGKEVLTVFSEKEEKLKVLELLEIDLKDNISKVSEDNCNLILFENTDHTYWEFGKQFTKEVAEYMLLKSLPRVEIETYIFDNNLTEQDVEEVSLTGKSIVLESSEDEFYYKIVEKYKEEIKDLVIESIENGEDYILEYFREVIENTGIITNTEDNEFILMALLK